MTHVFARRKTLFALLFVLLTILIVSCVPEADEPLISPQLGQILLAREQGQEIAVLPTPTPVLLTTLGPEQITAGLPADVAAALASADPARGDQVHVVAGCVGCHKLDPAEQGQGPTWINVADTAVSRVPGESPALYFYQSIVDPSAFVVPGYQDGVMPKTFTESLSPQEIADLMAFLLEQHR